MSPAIFKAYDIRGIVATALTEEAVSAIGLALGARARAAGIREVVVAGDGACRAAWHRRWRPGCVRRGSM